MSARPESMALRLARETCTAHARALGDALADIERRQFSSGDLDRLDKADRRLLDQFAYRYTRLQDDMGARLMPAVLTALGEEVVTLSALDRFNRLEQLGWLPSSDEWMELRQVRNQFAHEYPESAEERFERFQAAVGAARRLIHLLDGFERRLEHL
jgi:hypothetical protein